MFHYATVRRQERDFDNGNGTRKKDINLIFIIPWELPVATLGIRNLEGEAQPMAISFRAKPPLYAISWKVFQRIAEHRPRMRLVNREASLKSKFSQGEDVRVTFGHKFSEREGVIIVFQSSKQ
jgi:hypothetical protein